jgi:hypothetical protein
VKGSDSGPVNICGLDLNSTFSFSGVLVFKTSGVSLNAGENTAVVTNPATGKSIVIHGASLQMTSTPTDNGDGTISFIEASNGSYVVKAANGAPLSVGAGRLTARVTIDATTGDVVSVELLSVDGPHGTAADSNCDTFVPALT